MKIIVPYSSKKAGEDTGKYFSVHIGTLTFLTQEQSFSYYMM